jgi:hypothetical protein
MKRANPIRDKHEILIVTGCRNPILEPQVAVWSNAAIPIVKSPAPIQSNFNSLNLIVEAWLELTNQEAAMDEIIPNPPIMKNRNLQV